MPSDLEARVRRLEELALGARVRLRGDEADAGRLRQDIAAARPEGLPVGGGGCAVEFDVTITDGCTGSPVSGAGVSATRGTTVLSAITDGSGLAIVTGTVPGTVPGTWTISGNKVGYTAGSTAATPAGCAVATPVVLPIASTTPNVLSVTVTDACSGAALSGATVTASKAGQANVIGTTNVSGVASLAVPVGGVWTLQAAIATYTTGSTTATAACAATVSVALGLAKTTPTLLRFQSVLGCNSLGLAGATVTASKAGQANVTGTTNSSGQVDLAVPVAGAWSIAVSKARFQALTFSLTAVCNTTVGSGNRTLTAAAGYVCVTGCADPFPTTLVFTDGLAARNGGSIGGGAWDSTRAPYTRAGRRWNASLTTCTANASVAGEVWYRLTKGSGDTWQLQQRWWVCNPPIVGTATAYSVGSTGVVGREDVVGGGTGMNGNTCAIPLSLSFVLPADSAYGVGTIVTVTET